MNLEDVQISPPDHSFNIAIQKRKSELTKTELVPTKKVKLQLIVRDCAPSTTTTTTAQPYHYCKPTSLPPPKINQTPSQIKQPPLTTTQNQPNYHRPP